MASWAQAAKPHGRAAKGDIAESLATYLESIDLGDLLEGWAVVSDRFDTPVKEMMAGVIAECDGTADKAERDDKWFQRQQVRLAQLIDRDDEVCAHLADGLCGQEGTDQGNVALDVLWEIFGIRCPDFGPTARPISQPRPKL